MKKSLLLLIFILACKVSSFASHIVGGEFELVYLSGNSYRLNLIIYFDEINGNPGAKYEPTPIAWIYRKSDNTPMRQVTLPFRSETKVIYSLPDCQNDNVVNTTRMVFSDVISMNPEDFADPGGYYIAWQRCCRNYTIRNIISEDPDTGGVGAGQTFYLEIPPLIRNGERFINSSPQLFPPLSDYACVGRSFYADFTGTDIDGDSLVYSLVEPLNTPSAEPHPQPPSRAPYPRINWITSYNLDNIMHGEPDLYISRKGLLKVTPTETGLFVFAVKCEEFRDGEKIGEVRRDFQMVVVDCPDPGDPPDLGIKLADGSTYQEGDVLKFLADDDKCVEFYVKDEKGGAVNLNIDPVGYDDENFSIDILGTSASRDSLYARVCFTDCPPEKDLPFQVDFIGLDHTCPQPLQDTVRMTVLITPPDNDLPELEHREDAVGAYSGSNFRYIEVQEAAGGLKIVDLLGSDANNDFMEFTITGKDFDLSEYGMSVIDKRNTAGEVQSWLEWNYDCQQISFDGKTEFEILVSLEDEDDCDYDEPVIMTLYLKINLPPNTNPEVFSNNLGSSNEYVRIETPLNESISFDVKGRDLDGDRIVLNGQGANFDFPRYNIFYTGTSGQGTVLNTQLNWYLDCKLFNLEEQDSLRAYFFIEDDDKCEITNRDTLTVDFILSPPANSEFLFTMRGIQGTSINNNRVHMMMGEKMAVNLTGSDFEGDYLSLELIDRDEELSYQFENAQGQSTVSSVFSWIPQCSDLKGESSQEYLLQFVLSDDHCYYPKKDTLDLYVTIDDIDNKEDQFLPPNVFTPDNGDDKNDYFGMYRHVEGSEELENILPLDNCAGVFDKIVIVNRWGNVVFESNDREFKWDGKGSPGGVYFYYIQYSQMRFRGAITLLR
ncbi:gliding motility-associated C-terminal domain-containing protein [Fulvivirga ligni]|uniref:T9SS type B sorting domain-containing protein n=1 Tax=Fulvivirga ligni TaxID=2904246 RepID=UPI001F3C23F3|nr:gliding motility-associated C-terminal domain-containing protein [Fulvivirga ligni]UII21406.1 gliding motility-associated C-terminal domain-containing protein [Fulvivirga ligni]